MLQQHTHSISSSKSFCWPCKRADFAPCKRAPLAMMKAARKRGGNSAPNKRMPFPTVSQEALDKALMSYTRAMGIKQAFNLHQYKNLQKEQAESLQSIAALAKLVDNLLVVSSCKSALLQGQKLGPLSASWTTVCSYAAPHAAPHGTWHSPFLPAALLHVYVCNASP